MKETPLVIYHGHCMDGFTAAWACWLRHPDWEYYPATHGDAPPDVCGREVYMLDFSYKRPLLDVLAAEAKFIIILDHHISAQRDLEGFSGSNVAIRFDMEKSGARLAWEYFNEDGPECPLFVRIVEDRDLWRFAIPETRAVTAAVFSYPYNFDTWSDLHWMCVETIDVLVKQGQAIDRKQQKDIGELIPTIQQRMMIAGYKVPVANLPYMFASDACELMCGEHEPFAACYFDGPEGRTFKLRSRENGIDVSEIAKVYGGGGHKHSAGFRLSPGASL